MAMDYKLRKNSGALNEVAQGPLTQQMVARHNLGNEPGHARAMSSLAPDDDDLPRARRAAPGTGNLSGIFFYSVREGERVLVTDPDGTVRQVAGPKLFWRWRCRVEPMAHHIAHPGEFLILCYRDGRQEHIAGPTHAWFDPTVHSSIEKEDLLQIGNKEAIVVYSKAAPPDAPRAATGTPSPQSPPQGAISRRVIHGPATFMPAPGEWLHTFAWHGTRGGQGGYHKVPNGLIFQKLWLMPDQMYHDVTDVRTADDAVLTVRLMIFFVLEDLPRMLETTHDPIGDFINAATSDVIAFTGRHTFDAFKQNIQRLNQLDTYEQLLSRALQCGYRINKIVYRGYGSPDSLQRMHDEAIESRTRLQLERATREQAQDLEDFTLERTLARAARQLQEQEQSRARELQDRLERREAARAEELADAEQAAALATRRADAEALHLARLRDLGVDLTAYLCRDRPERRIEIAAPATVEVGTVRV